MPANTKRLTLLSLFTALSLIIFTIESAIPPLVPIPGIKLGLSNIITLILLTRMKKGETLCVLLARILLSSFFFGQAVSLLYSLCGGLLSFAVMACSVRLLRGEYLFLSGVLGGISHNLGQLLIALLITKTPGVLSYLPFLLLSGILTGLFTGLCAWASLKFLRPVFRQLD